MTTHDPRQMRLILTDLAIAKRKEHDALSAHTAVLRRGSTRDRAESTARTVAATCAALLAENRANRQGV